MHEGLYKMKGATGIYRNIWDYIADVVPDAGGETFRTTFTEIFEGFAEADPGTGPRSDFSTTMAAIAAARAAGDLDEVKRLKAEFAAARAQQ